MCIKFFLEVAKEYFDSIYSDGLYDEDDDTEGKIDEEDCYCNVNSVYRVFLSVLNHNKVD